MELKLKQGEEILLDGRGGWKIRVIGADDDGHCDLVHFNPKGEHRAFFDYTTVGNQYGAGMVEQEPTLGVPLRSCGVEADGNLIGAVVYDADGKVAARFSWSNIKLFKGQDFELTTEGELKVAGQSHGWLAFVFCADKNRIKGLVGVFAPTKPAKIDVLEMDSLFALLADKLGVVKTA